MQNNMKQGTVSDVQMLDHRQLTALMQFGDLESCADTFESYLDKVKFFSMESLMLRLYIGMDVYLAAQNVARGFGVTNEEFTHSFGSIDDISAKMQTVETTASYLQEMVAQCIRWRIASVSENGNGVIRKAKEYIDSNYTDEDISLNKVAENVGLTPTYLSALFKKESGQNFTDYVTTLRITRAKELLCCTKKLISEIAYEVGFRDYRYFSQIFKKQTGMTPRQFQNSTNELYRAE
jgi:two-component system response regulator YesN